MPVRNNLKEQRIGIIKKNINNAKKTPVTSTGNGDAQVENKWKSKQWTFMIIRNLYLKKAYICSDTSFCVNKVSVVLVLVRHFSPTTKPHL